MENYNKYLIEYKEKSLSERILNDITSENNITDKLSLTPRNNNKSEQTYNIILNYINKFKEKIKILPDYNHMNQDILTIIDDNKLSQSLNSLITTLKELIKMYTKENDNSKSLNNIISYLMNLIYNKIFPITQSEDDLKFEEICKNLNNININNLIKNDNNILNDDFLE